MKRILLLTLPFVMLLSAQSKQAAKNATKPAPKAAVGTGPISVPADATEIAPRVWRHTDKAGKTWIYRQTPFGLSKVEDNSAAIAAASAAAPVAASHVDVKATDLGSTVRFEKPTPMGNRVWTRTKAELSPEEKDWLEKSKSSDPAKQAAK